MSLAQLKDLASRLPWVEQRELIAHLVALQAERDAAFKRLLAQKIDDNDPAHWVELDELQRRYAD